MGECWLQFAWHDPSLNWPVVAGWLVRLVRPTPVIIPVRAMWFRPRFRPRSDSKEGNFVTSSDWLTLFLYCIVKEDVRVAVVKSAKTAHLI